MLCSVKASLAHHVAVFECDPDTRLWYMPHKDSLLNACLGIDILQEGLKAALQQMMKERKVKVRGWVGE
jgi:hypothetical protein